MSILVQREFTVLPNDRARFEELSRTGTWTTMVGFGSWAFGGTSDVLVTHSVYRDMRHWVATRVGGDLETNPQIRAQAAKFEAAKTTRQSLIQHSRARMFDLDEHLMAIHPAPRTPDDPLVDAPPTFGSGSVISELCYQLVDASARTAFEQISHEYIWPWLETQSGRLIALSRDPLGPPDEIVTLFAFRGLDDWHRLARPAAEEHPPTEIVEVWNHRHRLVPSQRGRLLHVGTDWGTPTA
jgi:hypothetical protein